MTKVATAFGRRCIATTPTCDADCTDLDFRLYDAQDVLIDRDTEGDDTPVVSVQPARRARYRLEVKMFTCNVEPCEHCVGTFRR